MADADADKVEVKRWTATEDRPDFKPTDVVVFVGNSFDAMADAQQIQDLQGTLQLECFHDNDDERLRPFRVKIYHWKEDSRTHGGQEPINRLKNKIPIA